MTRCVQIDEKLTDKDLLCPLIDARRMEVYTALFDNKVRSIEEQISLIIEEQPFQTYLSNNRIIYFGSGAEKAKPFINKEVSKIISNFQLHASYMSAESYRRYLSKEFANLSYAEPNYLKEFYSPSKLHI